MTEGRARSFDGVAILGGGIADLATAFYAKKAGLPFTVYEAGDRCGGNAATVREGDYLFDTGAHRFHDKDPVSTADVLEIMGEDIARLHIPSKIHHRGKLVDFPFLPLNLIKSLGPATFIASGLQALAARLVRGRAADDFESFARRAYGAPIAERFLLNYSEKLWGVPCRGLSADVSGERVKGLTLRSVLVEAFAGRRARARHVDGAFYYPRLGIGEIAGRMAAACGSAAIQTGSPVTRVVRDTDRLLAVETGRGGTVAADAFVSAIPLPEFVRMIAPAPPAEVLRSARKLRFRRLVLVALFLDRESVTRAATVYFPDRDFPFTRVYEPRNRSPFMSPAGRTSLVAEIPCWEDDGAWRAEDGALIERTASALRHIGWIRNGDIIGADVRRLASAYPVLEKDTPAALAVVLPYLARFRNLRLTGRAGRFAYSWIRDQMRAGRRIARDLAAS
jgi:protoporphyrinogen oxidase